MSSTAFHLLPGLSWAFLSYTVAVIAVLAIVGRRHLKGGMSRLLPLLPAVWAIWGFTVAASGLLQSSTRPPGIVLLVGPILLSTIVTIGAGALGRAMQANVPLAWLVGLQTFRVGVEAVIHELWRAGWMPRAMTLGGGNVELVYAASAPVVAWAVARGRVGRRFVVIWNAVGLLSLANVVLRGVGSAPGPAHFLHTEVANVAMGQFPFTLIPAVMVPLALGLHLVTARAAGMASQPSRRAAQA